MATSNKNITEEEWAVIKNVGALYRELREESKLTQQQVARAMKTSQSRLPVLENGQADMMLTTLMRYAKVYGYAVEVSVVKLAEEGELHFNEDGSVEQFRDGEWHVVDSQPSESIKEDAA